MNATAFFIRVVANNQFLFHQTSCKNSITQALTSHAQRITQNKTVRGLETITSRANSILLFTIPPEGKVRDSAPR
jgi:hypothetical protein